MINNNELRIGNLVQDIVSGEWLRVNAVSEDSVNTSILNRSKYPLPANWEMGPIRLTPEILENVFGFSYIPALYTHVLNIRNLDDVSYQHGMVFYAGHRVSDFSFPYVHELQNIYYLISKKELPVNLGYATTRIKKINQ